jgi:glycosyltransferase 2 family protein
MIGRPEGTPPIPVNRRTAGLAFRLLMSGGLLTLLLFLLPWEQIAAGASQITVALYLGALAGFLCGHVLGVAKWRMMLAASIGGRRLPIRDAVGFYGAGLFSNLFLPSVVGGDLVRAGLAARTFGRAEAVVLGGIADRLIDFTSLALIIIAGGLFAGAQMRGWVGPLVGLGLVVVLGAGVLLSPLALRRSLKQWPAPFRRRIGRALVALRHLGRSPRLALFALFLSIVMQVVFVLIGAWLGGAVGARAPLWAWFVVWPLAKAAGMLPVSLGGFGVRDAALAALLVPFGVPAAFGLVTSLAWNAVIIGGAVVGGTVGWLLRPGRGNELSMRSLRSSRTGARTAGSS